VRPALFFTSLSSALSESNSCASQAVKRDNRFRYSAVNDWMGALLVRPIQAM
jgi:hypothetical protein